MFRLALWPLAMGATFAWLEMAHFAENVRLSDRPGPLVVATVTAKALRPLLWAGIAATAVAMFSLLHRRSSAQVSRPRFDLAARWPDLLGAALALAAVCGAPLLGDFVVRSPGPTRNFCLALALAAACAWVASTVFVLRSSALDDDGQRWPRAELALLVGTFLFACLATIVIRHFVQRTFGGG